MVTIIAWCFLESRIKPPKSYQLIGFIYVLRSVTEHYIRLLLVLNQHSNNICVCCQLIVLNTRPPSLK